MANENDKQGTGINWGRIMERDPHGTADVGATMAKLEAEARLHVEQNEVPTERIRGAVATVYAANPKVQFDLGSLTNRVVTEMKVAAGSESKIGEAVKGFIRGESKSFEAFAKGESEVSGLYHIARGKTGGVRQVTPAYTTSFKEALKKKAAADAQ